MQQSELNVKLKKAFQEFREDSNRRLLVDLRRWRAAQIRELLSSSRDLDLPTFNQEIWQNENYSKVLGNKTKINKDMEGAEPGRQKPF